MTLSISIAAITSESLHRAGSRKWATPPGVIGATIAEMDFGVSDEIRYALRAAIDGGLLSYPPSAEEDRMRQACADWQRDAYGWNVPVERVRPLPDVSRALEAAISHFTSPGAAIVLLTPAHTPFFTIPSKLGRTVTQVPMRRDGAGQWKLDVAGIDAAFAAGGEMLVLCNPDNPTGKVYTREEMLTLVDIVDRHGARVFSDEIHAPLVFAGQSHVPYASVSSVAAGHAITATSASKGWNISGLKCAQLILSNDRDVALWDTVGYLYERGIGILGCIATTAAYNQSRPWQTDILGYLDSTRSLMRELVDEHLRGVTYLPPQGTYLAWLDCTGLQLGDHPADFFLEHAKVALNDGSQCGDAGRGHVRVNMATPQPILTSMIERMGQAIETRH